MLSESALHQFHCPYCQGVFQAESGARGAQVVCPHCRSHVTVPSTALAPVSHSPPPPPPSEKHGSAAAGPTTDRIQEDTPTTAKEARVAASVPPTPEPRIAASHDPLTPAVPPAPTEPPFPFGSPIPAVPNSLDEGKWPKTSESSTPNPESPVVVLDAKTKYSAEDTSEIQIHDGPRTIKYGNRVVQLRQLTPEERARHRLINNLVVVGISLVVLLGYLFYHLKIWPFDG